MSDCFGEAETKDNLNAAEEESMYHGICDETLDLNDKRKSIDVTQNKVQIDNEKSNIKSVVSLKIEDEVVLCSEDETVEDARCQEVVKAPSKSSDEEFTKKSKLFRFIDSDLPDSDEIRDILMSYPKPTITECFSEIEETEESWQEEIYLHLRRAKSAQIIDIEKLPERFITRHRKMPERLGVATNKYLGFLLKSRYVNEQEEQIDHEILAENVKRLKKFAKDYKQERILRNNNKTYEDKETNYVNDEKSHLKDVNFKSPSGRISAEIRKRYTKDATKTRADVKPLFGSTAEISTRRRRSRKNESKGSSLSKIKIRRSIRQKEGSSRKKTDNKNNEPNEKRKVKMEKRKKYGTKSKNKSFVQKSAESKKNTTNDDSLESTSTAKVTTRRTRSKKKEIYGRQDENKLSEKSTENRKRTYKKQEKEILVLPEIVVRRSKRKKIIGQGNNDTKKTPKFILKNSTDIKVSSCSSKLPKSLKRSLVQDSDMPSPKRTRTSNANNNNNNNGINLSSLRATPAKVMKTQHVLLSSAKSEPDTKGPFVRLGRYEPPQKQTRTRKRNILKGTRNFIKETRSSTTRSRRERH